MHENKIKIYRPFLHNSLIDCCCEEYCLIPVLYIIHFSQHRCNRQGYGTATFWQTDRDPTPPAGQGFDPAKTPQRRRSKQLTSSILLPFSPPSQPPPQPLPAPPSAPTMSEPTETEFKPVDESSISPTTDRKNSLEHGEPELSRSLAMQASTDRYSTAAPPRREGPREPEYPSPGSPRNPTEASRFAPPPPVPTHPPAP